MDVVLTKEVAMQVRGDTWTKTANEQVTVVNLSSLGMRTSIQGAYQKQDKMEGRGCSHVGNFKYMGCGDGTKKTGSTAQEGNWLLLDC